jgi:TraY domain
MNSEHRPRIGRPPADGREARGDYVGFRSPSILKAKLEQAAKASGRSLSTEAQFRLEQSFRGETGLYEALQLAFGKQGSEFLLLLGRALRNAPFFISLTPEDDWLSNPSAYAAAACQIELILEVLRPPGDAVPAIPAQAEEQAARLLWGLGGSAPPNTPLAAWGQAAREALGPAVAARAAAWSATHPTTPRPESEDEP